MQHPTNESKHLTFIIKTRLMGHGDPDANQIKSQEVLLTQTLDYYDRMLSESPYLTGKVSGLKSEFILSKVRSALITDKFPGVRFGRPLPYALATHAPAFRFGGRDIFETRSEVVVGTDLKPTIMEESNAVSSKALAVR